MARSLRRELQQHHHHQVDMLDVRRRISINRLWMMMRMVKILVMMTTTLMMMMTRMMTTIRINRVDTRDSVVVRTTMSSFLAANEDPVALEPHRTPPPQRHLRRTPSIDGKFS